MRWGVVHRPVFPARNARAMALQHPCNDDSETFSPLGSLGVLQCLSAASGVRFPSHRYVPPPVCRPGRPARLRTSSSPHRLPLKACLPVCRLGRPNRQGGVIFRRDRVGKRGSYRFLFYEKMTVGVGLESRPFACHSRPGFNRSRAYGFLPEARRNDGRACGHINHSPLEGESQRPSREAKADAVGGCPPARPNRPSLPIQPPRPVILSGFLLEPVPHVSSGGRNDRI